MTMQLTGAFTALITPFRHQEIDEPALRSLVEFQISNGIHGLVPCGTTGESATMTEDERRRVIEIVIDQTAGRVPSLPEPGSNDTRRTIEATQHAQAVGANAALVVVPYYNKPTQDGLIAHYTAIAELFGVAARALQRSGTHRDQHVRLRRRSASRISGRSWRSRKRAARSIRSARSLPGLRATSRCSREMIP